MNYIQQRVMELRNNDYIANPYSQQLYAAEPQWSGAQTHLTSPTTVPQMKPRYKNTDYPPSEFEGRMAARPVINPYTKVPLLTRRRRYPSFY